VGATETPIQRSIMDALELLPAVAWCCRLQSGRVRVKGGWMHLAPTGSPDIIGGLRGSGRIFGIEVKGPKGRQSDGQEETERRWLAAGLLYWVCRDVTEAVEMVQRAAKEKRR
jgi:hypothetical protein